jgi:predicted nucleic acid-binding protein
MPPRSSRKPSVAEVWIVNASPVILLARIGQLELVSRLADRVLLPDAVAREILAGPAHDPARQVVEGGWGQRVSPHAVAAEVVEWSLGAGESEVLSLAREQSPATAVVDDAEARACARVLGIPVIGTLGVVVRAKRKGLLSSAAAAIGLMRERGFYIADDVVAEALRTVGEAWPRRP